MAGITNLGDTNPPFRHTVDRGAQIGTYRLLGRTYFKGIRLRL